MQRPSRDSYATALSLEGAVADSDLVQENATERKAVKKSLSGKAIIVQETHETQGQTTRSYGAKTRQLNI